MTRDELARTSWQSAGAGALPPIETVRAGADSFRRKIRRRNGIEYAAGAIVIPVFAGYAIFLPGWPVKLGSILVIVGTLFVLWNLHRRGSPLTPDEHGGTLGVIEFQRRELVRQRDLLASVFSWYIAPFLPGMALIVAGSQMYTLSGQWIAPPLQFYVVSAMIAAVFVGIWLLNRAGARRLQHEIERLDALSRD